MEVTVIHVFRCPSCGIHIKLNAEILSQIMKVTENNRGVMLVCNAPVGLFECGGGGGKETLARLAVWQ